jgi:hypothetical protein
MAYLNRRNLILASISGLILFYFSTLALEVYLGMVLLVAVGLYWRSADRFAKMANFIANTTILIVTFLVCAVLLEVALHLKPHLFTGDFSPDIVGEFSDFTSRGYLTEEVFKKPQSVFRILGLGDSFAVKAADKKKNYHNFLQEKLNGLGPRKVEVVNAGMPAIGPGYYRQILETCGDRFQPDLVLVSFFVGNDFEEWEMFITIGNFIYEPKDLKQKMWEYHRVQNSRLIKLIRRKLMYFKEEQQRAKEVQATGAREVGTFSREVYLEIEKNRGRIFRKDKDNRLALERDWRQCARVIGQMKQWCAARKVELVLMISPDQFQVDEDLRSQVLEKYRIPADSLDLEYPNSLITNFCRENHIFCLDLLHPFQEKGKSMPLYVLHDSHWNEAGNRLAAEQIFNFLQDHHLIKAD